MDRADSSLQKPNKLDDQVAELKKKLQEVKRDIQVLLDQVTQDDSESESLRNKNDDILETGFGLNEAGSVVSAGLAGTLKLADRVQFALVSEAVPELKRRQQISCIGGPADARLDGLQTWFTSVAESLLEVRRQLDVLQSLDQDDELFRNLRSLQEEERSLFSKLLTHSLVVEKQPCMIMHPQSPLVLKIGVQFTVKVRLLVRLPDLNELPKIKITIDEDLPESVKSFQLCSVLLQTKMMKVEGSSGCLVAEFRCLVRPLKQSRNTVSKSSLPIIEQLHEFRFDVQLNLSGRVFDLTTTSLPVVVITPFCSMYRTWASILWYNMLSTEDQDLAFFFDPPKVAWDKLSEVLDWQFSTAGRCLGHQQLSLLRDKLIGGAAGDSEVSWSQFSRENMPGKGFGFWQWLDSLLMLIRRHLNPIWADGNIMGFVSEDMAQALLKDKEPGTFLLHFCESRLGSITFTWVERKHGEVKFTTAEPYSHCHLSATPLADIIHDYKVTVDGDVSENPLKFLYPGIPRDEALGKYVGGQNCGNT